MAQKKTISVTAILIAASGWIVSFFLGLLDLPAKINSFMDEGPRARQNVTDWLLLDQNFTGKWTSSLEGWVDATDQERSASNSLGGPVSLRLRVYNGKVEGEIESVGLEKSYIYSAILIEGEKRDGVIDLFPYDYIDGKKTTLAHIRLTLDENDKPLPMHLETIKQGGPFFPEKASLFRTSTDVSEAIAGRLNMDLMKQVLERGRTDRERVNQK
jgi:hypothetical protein